jgi:hypothetical protein
MGWFSSIVIGLITAALGGVGAGFVANKCVRWYRISSFEGGAGYYVVGIALLGIFVGLIIGIICARIVAGGEAPGFPKGLGVALGSMGGLVLASGLLAWLGADLSPTIGDNDVELLVEIRGPKDFTVPEPEEKYGAFASVYLPRGRSQPQAELNLKEATLVDGRWIVTATVPLDTSVSNKYLRVFFNKDNDPMFALNIPRHLLKKDSPWSSWVESGWNVGQPEPPPEGKFNMRFKVQEVIPPPPGPTQADEDAKKAAAEQAAFEAIPADAPVEVWLPHTRYGAAADRLRVAVERITDRPNFIEELGVLMRSEDQKTASDAMAVIDHIPQPLNDLNAPVEAAGRDIVERIRRVNATTVEEDPSYLRAADVSLRFGSWMVATRALRKKTDGDFTGELRQILELSRVRTDSYVMQVSVCRVASYYMHQWAGLEPLPTDPKPR